MEDSLYLGVFIYTFIALSVSAMLPSEFFLDEQEINNEELLDNLNITNQELDTAPKQINFLLKMVTLWFAPFVIPGIPVIVQLGLTFLNYMSIIIGAVFIYDKVRGI